MKISTTLILAFLLGGLGTYYFLWEKPSHLPAGELGPARILIFDEGDSITRLHLSHRNSKEKFSLARLDSGWRFVSPVSYPAEDFLVEGMVQALVFSQRIRRFASDGSETPEEFGFQSPEIELGIQTKNSPLRRTLVIGKESPVGVGVYARWEGEKEYFLIPREVKASLERSLYSLRRKKLFRVNWDRVTGLHVKVERQEFQAEKSGAHWHWVLPAPRKEIPVEKVSELIYAFQSLYVKEFLDRAPVTTQEFGLKGRQNFLEALGAGETEKLFVGSPVKGKDSVYSFRQGENLVLLVSAQNLKTLLETFDVTFRETKDVDSGKSGGGPNKDSSSVPAGGKTPL